MAEKLTKSDIEKIQKEIEHRKLEVRPKLIAAVKEARAHGDLSENFEYKAAKREKNQNESRISYLERMIKTAIIVSEASADGKVSMNNRVTLYYPDDDFTEEIKIVTSIRGNSREGKISPESPLGAAIFGHAAGETVKVPTPDSGSYDVTIQSIDQSANDDDDSIRGF
ncbi:MAG: transcription elongation factor GreA [Lachnospiraceae bacterium]|nr:transcription elongation factor GreA [Lachnospiraceae bacterium]